MPRGLAPVGGGGARALGVNLRGAIGRDALAVGLGQRRRPTEAEHRRVERQVGHPQATLAEHREGVLQPLQALRALVGDDARLEARPPRAWLGLGLGLGPGLGPGLGLGLGLGLG